MGGEAQSIGDGEPPAAAALSRRARAGDVLRALRRPKVAVMLALGFSSGLPFLLIGNTLSYWLGDAHVNLALIGYLSWVGLAYSLKFIWGAVVDNLPAPMLDRLGRRRGWLIWAQIGVGVGLVGMSTCDPQYRLEALTAFAILTAFAAATQDVVIDAWRIEIAAVGEELDLMTSAYKLGYQIAAILTASVILWMASTIGWQASYATFGAFMLVGLAATIFAEEPARSDAVMKERSRGLTGLGSLVATAMRFVDVVAGPFVAFFKQFGPTALLILITISAYHLSDYLRGPVINPFYVQVGLHKSAVAAVRLSVGLPFTILGIAAGGLFAARFGRMAALVAGALIQPVAVAAFGVMIYTGPNLAAFSGLMALDDFCMNFAGVALIAYMSTLTTLGYTATQYALLTSALAWTGKFLKGFSGVVVLDIAKTHDMAHAYALFFLGAGAMGAFAIALSLVLAALDRRRRFTPSA